MPNADGARGTLAAALPRPTLAKDSSPILASSCEVHKGSTRIQVLPASTTTTPVDSASLHFKVNYEQVKHLAIDEVVSSEVVSVGQHLWRIDSYPRGPVLYSQDDKGNYVSIFLKHMSDSRSVRANFVAFINDRDDQPSEIPIRA
ncbi:BTB/POZ and MATH domain-containing protein 3-like [Aegilops tauschii subsp. strangulata]|uniref:BTB/POZ and MATH domain-containing protein 3-like n=1 Tax=Aegilops tauschii subsp. strangulata TaxID=200361 RepID=UPI003CC86E80